MTLREYVVALIAQLQDADPAAIARMRSIVGDRRARIRLGEEAVEVVFLPERFEVTPARPETPVDGEGVTEPSMVLDILDGRLEISDALVSGDVEVFGAADDIVRMMLAIEILLDGSVRIPSLQSLARDFREQHAVDRSRRAPNVSRGRPSGGRDVEEALLARLDLLPVRRIR